ncbi:hypothetical protein NDU88_000964 [Pleurodeles waltl]|uniref:Uncharacterized protein n=1 Tax=Pleurodeles waltl TaxID=8319 RepID=A0AAV7TGI4_PLEWA|nr:hypothetical protein NDU88_000964 [Pleurodeles waltl]
MKRLSAAIRGSLVIGRSGEKVTRLLGEIAQKKDIQKKKKGEEQGFWAPMMFDVQISTFRYPYTPTPLQPVRSVIKRAISDVRAAVAGIAGFMRTLPYALRTSMVPKNTRNSRDKLNGSKMTRAGRDKGDLAGSNRRLMQTIGISTGKNMPGTGKEPKMSNSITPLLEVRGKDKSQSTIMTFLTGGARDSSLEHITLPSEISPSATGIILSDTSSEKTLIENNEPIIKAIQGSKDLLEVRNSNTGIREKVLGPLAGKEQSQLQLQPQPQAQQPENQIREGDANTLRPMLDNGELQKISLNSKGWNKVIEKDLKSSDWVKDSSDKFYSLTEESDLSSSEHSFSESGSSETSETRNKSSSNELTVRQLRRQRKCTKPRPCLQEGLENLTSTGGRTLKWDYSGTRLMDTPITSEQGLDNNNVEGDTGDPANNVCSVGSEVGMLQSIFIQLKNFKQRPGLKVGTQE